MVRIMVKNNVSKAFSFDGIDWKRVVLGLRKPAIALISYGLTQAANYPQFAFLSGVSAAALWGIVEFYIREI